MIITRLKIRIFGDPVLRKKSVPVKEVGAGERVLIASMIETMHAGKGIGLAAPQVGINQQIIVADIGDGPMAFINPKVTKKSGSAVMEEGCLSLPGVMINVRRPTMIFLSYLDENNKKIEREYTDLLARVILHEMDHLRGKLIADYAGWRERIKYRQQLKKLRAESKLV